MTVELAGVAIIGQLVQHGTDEIYNTTICEIGALSIR